MELAETYIFFAHQYSPFPSSGLLGSVPTGFPAWMNSLDSQAATWRNHRVEGRWAASFATSPQARAASRATLPSSQLGGKKGKGGGGRGGEGRRESREGEREREVRRWGEG